MNLKKWLEEQGINIPTLARMCGLSRTTIRNLALGNNPAIKTAKKLVERTKNMKNPVTYTMFKKIRKRSKKEIKK